MKQNKFFLGLATIAAAVFSFSSCSQDELSTVKAETPDQGQEILLSTNFSTTRSISQTIQNGNQIANGVHVGVFVTDNNSTSSFLANGNNNSFTADGDGGLTIDEATKKVYYPKTGSVNIYAYAPYQSSWNVTDVNANQDFTVQADQSSETNYLASDLIWATPQTNKSSTTENLALPFAHKLSKININIVNNRSGLSLKGATVSILNTVRTATINPSTGAVAAKDGVTASAITAATYGTESEPTATTESPATASAIIVPQTIAANTKFIQVITNAGQNNNESTTLTAKIGTSNKTFASNKRYNYTLTINDNSVELTFNGTSLGTWEDENESGDLEDDTPAVTYTKGDYVLTDGTFVKASALTDAQKSSVAGIIFSTTVSTTDATAGYGAYIMGLTRQKKQYPVNNDIKDTYVTSPAITTLTAAISDMDGLYRTNTILESTYGQAISNTIFNVKTWYTDRAFTAGTHSDWYLPSFGQLVEIFNNLGGANITTELEPENMDSSSDYNITTDTEKMSTIMTTLQSKVTAVGITTSMFSVPTSGNIQYITSTENGSTATDHKTKMWGIKITSSALVFNKNMARVSETSANTYSVIPVAAVKLPTE